MEKKDTLSSTPSAEAVAAERGLDLAYEANNEFDLRQKAKADRAALERAQELGASVPEDVMNRAQTEIRKRGELFGSLLNASGHLIGKGALGEPAIRAERDASVEVQSPTAERIREQIETSRRSALRQVEAMRAAGITEEKIPEIPGLEAYKADVEACLGEWYANGALELIDEGELTPRLPYVLDAKLDGVEWSAVFRQLVKEQPNVYVNEEFLGKFSAETMSGEPEAAGPRLESQERIDELSGTVAQQKAGHEALQAKYPEMNIPEPSFNSLVAGIAYEIEQREDGVLKGNGTFERTYGRLYTVDGLPGAGGRESVPDVCVDDDGGARADGAWVEFVRGGRLSVGKNL